MSTSVTITKSEVLDFLMAESTNVARTYVRQDGVSMHDDIVVDEQAFDSLQGSWNEAVAKLSEKAHEFLSSTVHSTNNVAFNFKSNVTFVYNDNIVDDVTNNLKMYIVNYMMAQWLSNLRPEMVNGFVSRCNFELDDLLHKLYKKEPPVGY